MNQPYETLEVTRDHHVVTVALNRPEALNAINTAMGRELLDCFESLFWDKEARVVILTGTGEKAFCVGGDLKERQGMSDDDWRDQHVIFEQAAFRLLHCPQPVIAAVEGFAMGGGCELAVLSDFVVAGATAVFAVPEVTRGIFPGIGGTQMLPRIVGGPFAKEMVFTGRRVAAEEAKAVGLINHLVPAGEAAAKAREIADTIAKNGPIAVRQAKKAVAWGSEVDLQTGMRLSIEAYNITVNTEDRLEGVRAFNERRPPAFQGR
jgi:enoyl-CoA hydratase/carnithine racemase